MDGKKRINLWCLWCLWMWIENGAKIIVNLVILWREKYSCWLFAYWISGSWSFIQSCLVFNLKLVAFFIYSLKLRTVNTVNIYVQAHSNKWAITLSTTQVLEERMWSSTWYNVWQMCRQLMTVRTVLLRKVIFLTLLRKVIFLTLTRKVIFLTFLFVPRFLVPCCLLINSLNFY